MAKPTMELSQGEQEQLKELVSRGVRPVRVVRRAQVLRLLAEGQPATRVGAQVGLNRNAVRQIAERYRKGGLERALYDQPRCGAPPKVQAAQKQQIIAMVCGAPPVGRARWTIRLIAEEAVKRKLVGRVGRETIRILLCGHDLKPWREKNVVCGRGRPAVPPADGRRAGPLRATAR